MKMRIPGSLLVLFVAVLAFGVFSHHMLTIGQLGAAIAGLGACGVVAVVVSVALLRALKGDVRLWPRISAGVIQLFFACEFLSVVRSPDYPRSYLAASVTTGFIFILCGGAWLISINRERGSR